MTIYLDNAASTPMLEEVKTAFIEAIDDFANPSSIHSPGVVVSKKVEMARDSIAQALKAKPEEIYFTSGGTESNNWVLKSVIAKKSSRKKIVTSAIEHPSILAPLKWLEENFEIELLVAPVDSSGIVNIAELKKLLNEDVLLCSLMHVNNETGIIQPIEEIAEHCFKRGILFHVDACQSFLKIPLNLNDVKLTYLTINSHKIHGPKGIGALFMRNGHELAPLLFGGGHELNRRSGTLNAPAIVGFGKAVAIQQKNGNQIEEMSMLLNWLSVELKNHFSKCEILGDSKLRAPHILNVRFAGHSAKDLFWVLNKAGIALSTASACSSNRNTPSHVLKAMGQSDQENLESIRISIGMQTTKEELEQLVQTLKGILT